MACPTGALTWGLFKFRSSCSLFLGLADGGHAAAHSGAEPVHASNVVREVHAAVVIDAHGFASGESVLIRSQKLELPFVVGLLMSDASLHVC